MARRRRPRPDSAQPLHPAGNRPGPALAALRARPRLVAAAGVAVLIIASIGMWPASSDRNTGNSPPVEPLDLAAVEMAAPAVAEPAGGMDAAAVEPLPPDPRSWTYVQVARGETLERIFRRLDLSPALLHQVVNLDEHTRSLAKILPGDEFAFEIDPEDGFRALRGELDDETWLFVESDGESLSSRTEPRDLEVRVVEAEGEIASSLYAAAKSAGLSDNMVLRLASIFGWDIDFALDIRRGDRFALVYEEVFRDGEFLRDGAIRAARFTNRGNTFEAVRFDAGNGPDYYAPDGRPMRKAFLRAPLNFTRVTSNFNPRRFHPVSRRVRPHNGTDYGAATGTPVWASGDGKVIESAYNSVNGHYVFIQHGNHIITRYLHLSKRSVNRGDRVRQGQTIGLVGSTGLATGPHLHYEFLVNGAHRDPRRVDLPEADPLPEELLPQFEEHARPLLTRLEELTPERVLLAGAGKGCRDRSGKSC